MFPSPSVICLAAVCGIALPLPAQGSLVFDPAAYTVKSATLQGRTFSYRAYEGIVYVKFPVDARLQSMSIYIPVEYFEGRSVGAYTAATAPIFLPNTIGGYMPGPAGGPGQGFGGGANAALVALSRGCVVAAPGARGRTTVDASGAYTGKAPAALVDLKAAVRFLRANDAGMPGNAERIISNGTSAGGALSALLGATGNHPDYEPYLKALGAAEARDDVFAVSTYCPITNLDHADMAYEWLFCGINDYTRGGGPRPGQKPPAGFPAGGAPGGGVPTGGVPAGGPPAGGPPAGGPPTGGAPGGMPPGGPGGPPAAAKGTLSAEQVKDSKALKAQFPAYVNGLALRAPDGKALTLDITGEGPFKEHLKGLVMASAQAALKAGKDLSGLPWLTIQKGTVTGLDFEAYVRAAGRQKATLAFDGLDLGTAENGLFGTGKVDAQHFTAYGQAHGKAGSTLADPSLVKLMNPMAYIGTPGTTVAGRWRIRHGSVDRDTSLAIPVILATRLANTGAQVDFALPWGEGHGGDYDLDDLFAWIDGVCR